MGKRGPKPGAKNAGRPKIELDEKMFIKYCQNGSTLEAIAYYFECDMDTVNAWCKRKYKKTFSEVYKKHGALLDGKLRSAQIRSALGEPARTVTEPDGTVIEYKGLAPSVAMQIWLGKQRLGQVDQPVDESREERYERLPTMTADDKKTSKAD